jgi:glycosyltransferase involved in cell wall biosynthesis
MKVALVHDQLVKLGGAERVLKVLSEMFPSAPIFTLFYDESKVGRVFEKSRVRASYLNDYPRFLTKRRRYLFPLIPRAIESFDLSAFDLVISSNTAYSHGLITNTDTTHISYCHSPMRFAWDWTHEYLNEQNMSNLKKIVARHLLKKVRIWDYYSSDRPDHYVANSRNIQRRIQKYYRQDSSVLYPPVDVTRFQVNPNHENFFLIVSTLTPYKNIELAVNLFNKVRKRLVVIGDGSDRSRLKSLAGPHIDFLGFKPDEVVREYMQNCRALIFPGEEDFGITPVEAMACGKPVLAFGKGGVRESVVPGVTGEFFEEATIESMENALARLMVNEARYDAKRIRRRAEEFEREHFVEGMQQIIEKVMSK